MIRIICCVHKKQPAFLLLPFLSSVGPEDRGPPRTSTFSSKQSKHEKFISTKISGLAPGYWQPSQIGVFLGTIHMIGISEIADLCIGHFR